MTPSTAALVLAWVCVVLLALATAGLLRRVQALEQNAGPAGGAAAPPGPRPGLQVPIERHLGPGLGGDREVLLLVVSPTCASCAAALSALEAADPRRADVVVASAESSLGPLALPAGFTALPGAGALVDVLGVPATPYLVRLAGDGTILAADVVTTSTNLTTWTGGPALPTSPPLTDVTLPDGARSLR
jgi:hypothetical protein